MADKFYRVKQDNFLWSKDAILKLRFHSSQNNGYRPISDIWDTTGYNDDEYISDSIVENNPDWFERVYEVNMLTKVVYETKEKAKELISKSFKE